MTTLMHTNDGTFMQRAMALAKQGLYTTPPNPRVGCVIVRENMVLGEGYHHEAGGPHAERFAIQAALNAGHDLTGATAYITLEPCTHHGRTPPCLDALLPLKLARVVVAMPDPNPQVAGRGIAALRNAGVVVDVGLMQEEALWLNRGFVMRMQHKRPWVRLKVATSMDGRTALPNGKSQWLTAEQARLHGHDLRAQACAVLTGMGTIRADNPQLNVRDIPTPRQPTKVLLGNSHNLGALLNTASNTNLKALSEGHIVLVCTHYSQTPPSWLNDHPNRNHIEHLAVRNLPSKAPSKTEHLALLPVLMALARMGMNEVHVEAGPKLAGSLLQQGLVDELVQYVAPVLLGPGLPMADLPQLEHLPNRELMGVAIQHEAQDPRIWQLQECQALGLDVMLHWVRPHPCTLSNP